MGWNAGDKAACIKSGRRSRKGQVYTVLAVWWPGAPSPSGRIFNPKYDCPGLFLEGLDHENWTTSVDSARCRKVVPDEPKSECETDFRTLLKSRELVVLK